MTSTRPGPIAGVAGEDRSERTAAEAPRPTSPVDADLARELLDGLGEAVLTTDDAGLVVLVNAMAGELLPEIVVGTDLTGCPLAALAAATATGADDFDAEHLGRRLRGVRRTLGGNRSAWYVRDVTDEHARETELLAERRRTRFLADAGRQLGLALEGDQALHAVATLPVPYLADLALVVYLPPTPTEHRPHWVRQTVDHSAPASGTVGWDVVTAVPGLVEALDGEPADPRPWPAIAREGIDQLVPAELDPSALLVSPIPGAGRTAAPWCCSADRGGPASTAATSSWSGSSPPEPVPPWPPRNCTTNRATSPGFSSTACCRRGCPRWPACAWPGATARPGTDCASVATSTTSCRPATVRCSPSATSAARAWVRPCSPAGYASR